MNSKILNSLKLKKLNNLNYKTIIKYNFLLFNSKDLLKILLKNLNLLKKNLNFVNKFNNNSIIKIDFYSIIIIKLVTNNSFIKFNKFNNNYFFYYINISFLITFFKNFKKSNFLVTSYSKLPSFNFINSLKKNYSFFFSSLTFYNKLTD